VLLVVLNNLNVVNQNAKIGKLSDVMSHLLNKDFQIHYIDQMHHIGLMDHISLIDYIDFIDYVDLIDYIGLMNHIFHIDTISRILIVYTLVIAQIEFL
jgi:alpha-D-ribose 1-methylphosphonate 5-triphosphate synthase subunit PhnI